MNKLRSVLAMVMAFCLILTAASAFAEKPLEGDANVDQRNYPSTAPFMQEQSITVEAGDPEPAEA